MYRILHRAQDKKIREIADIDQIDALVGHLDTFTWVDCFAPKGEEPADGHGGGKRATLEHVLRDHMQFHPLAVDDVLTECSTPKVDDWDSYLFIVLHAVQWDPNLKDVDTAELDIFLGKNYLITYHEEPIPALERTWKNALREERHTRRGSDFVLYELADAIVADYMPCMDAMDDAIDDIEDQVFQKPTTATLQQVFKIKSAVLNLRRVLSPQREVMNKLARDDYAVIDARDRVYYRDVYDHVVRLVDLNESLRDLVTGALDTYLSVAANRTNDVVKILTIFTALFSPISAITGFFGMNFFGEAFALSGSVIPGALFAIVILLIVLVPISLLLYIHRRGWW
jgi:magnesium transporter